jgi:hypothetical protein
MFALAIVEHCRQRYSLAFSQPQANQEVSGVTLADASLYLGNQKGIIADRLQSVIVLE